MLLGVLGIGRALEAALGGPGIEVGHGVHDATAELAKARAADRSFETTSDPEYSEHHSADSRAR